MNLQKIPDYVKGIIYAIHCSSSDKYYIGQTRTHRRKGTKFIEFGSNERWKEHIGEALNPTVSAQCRLLNSAIRKYGIDKFTVTDILKCDISLLDENESENIILYNSLAPNGYNLTSGGRYQMMIHEEVRQRLSESGKKYFQKDGMKENQSMIISDHYYYDIIDRYSKMNIEKIEIRPINEKDEFHLVYLYVFLKDEEETKRIRIGGKHMKFEDSLKKAKDIANSLLNDDNDKIKISNLILHQNDVNSKYYDKASKYKDKNIKHVRLTVHKHTKNEVVSLFIRTDEMKSWNEEHKIVFGGKLIDLKNAYDAAKGFIDLLNIKESQIIIKDERLKTFWQDSQIAGNSLSSNY